MTHLPSGARRAVLIDLDGTLVDSFPGIAAAYHHVLHELGLADMHDADLKQFIGPPIQEALTKHFGLSGNRLDDGVRIFRDHYGSEGLFRFTKYPGVDEMLVALRDRQVELCVATSKLQTMAIQVVEHAGWTDLFSVVGGAVPDGTRHLKHDVVAWTLTQVASEAVAFAMVGDRADDIVAARGVGIRGIGVAWGYGSTHELRQAGAEAIADSPDHLLAMLTAVE